MGFEFLIYMGGVVHKAQGRVYLYTAFDTQQRSGRLQVTRAF